MLPPPPRPCHLLTDHGVQPLQNGLAKGDGPRKIRKVLNLMALFRTAFSQQPLSKAGPTRDCFKDFPFCPFVRHICPLGEGSISQFQLFPYAFLSFRASRDASCFICSYLFVPPGKPSWMGDQRSPTQLLRAGVSTPWETILCQFPQETLEFQPPNVGVPAWVPLLCRKQHDIMSHSLEFLGCIISRLPLKVPLSSLKEDIFSSLCVCVCVGRDSWHTNCPLRKSSGLQA